MLFFLPDSQDLVDPTFDFSTEKRSIDRVRQRDDVYAHEIFSKVAYDGLLVSKAIVDGTKSGGRYTLGQRHRLLREGAKRFLRTTLPIMGDCGAFTYVKESIPPFTPEQVLGFYEECGFDLGMSVDHVILEYEPELSDRQIPRAVRDRQELTLELAAEFIKLHRKAKLGFVPIGVAQGWSPASYARSVRELQRMGFNYIAMGGMVPLKTPDVLKVLAAGDHVRKPTTRFHLLGITRLEQLASFSALGVASFDSTSPLRQAFKDKDDNYYAMDRTYVAIRVPQVEGNPRLQKLIRAGKIPHDEARRLEKACLAALEGLTSRASSIDQAVALVHEYEQLFDPGRDNRVAYRELLTRKPWKECPCEICRELDHHVVLFRGAERNRRRGLHNVWVFYRRLKRELATVRRSSAGAAKVARARAQKRRPERLAASGSR